MLVSRVIGSGFWDEYKYNIPFFLVACSVLSFPVPKGIYRGGRIVEAVDSFLRIKAFVEIVATISKLAVEACGLSVLTIFTRFPDSGKCVSFHNAAMHLSFHFKAKATFVFLLLGSASIWGGTPALNSIGVR